MLEGIDDKPPAFSTKRHMFRPSTSSDPPRPRRQTMTEREASAFNDMFNMIFEAVSEHSAKTGAKPKVQQATVSSRKDPLTGAGIGRGLDTGDGVGDLLTQLRRHSKKVKRTGEDDEVFERKREQIELCETDQQLLEWAVREVFEESVRHEQAARSLASTSSATSSLPLQPPAYARIVALLMRTFRDRYHDPHLALALFAHAKRLSIASYVFGCAAPAYNELIATRWRCFKDLRGVLDAMEEMRVNGVEPDVETRKLVEELRRDVGERVLWSDQHKGVEEWKMVRRIEELSVRSSVRTRRTGVDSTQGRRNTKRWNAASESWKIEDQDPNADESEDGSWRFGDWGTGPRRQDREKEW